MKRDVDQQSTTVWISSANARQRTAQGAEWTCLSSLTNSLCMTQGNVFQPSSVRLHGIVTDLKKPPSGASGRYTQSHLTE